MLTHNLIIVILFKFYLEKTQMLFPNTSLIPVFLHAEKIHQ